MTKFEIIRNKDNPPVSLSKKFLKISDVEYQSLMLMKQNDGNQCGVCSVANLLVLLDYKKLNNALVFMSQARSALSIDDNAWLTSINVIDLLKKEITELGLALQVIGGYGENMICNFDQEDINSIDIQTSAIVDSPSTKGLIVNSDRHYIAIGRDQVGWIISDSLSDTIKRATPEQVKYIY